MTLREKCIAAAKIGNGIDISGCHYGHHKRTNRYIAEAPYYKFLAGFVRESGACKILEIGTFSGGSAMAMLRGVAPEKKADIVTIDIKRVSNTGLDALSENVKRITGDSTAPRVVEQVLGHFKDGCDIIFIDSKHDDPSIRANMEAYLPLKPKFIVLDDIKINPSMEEAWKRLFESYDCFDASGLAERNVGFGVVSLAPRAPVTIACVLKQKGEFFNRKNRLIYNPSHVSWLHEMARKHVTHPHEFVCISDVPVDCNRIKMKHGWPGWWGKMELFRPGLFNTPVFYLDLDTVILGNINDMLRPTSDGSLTVLRNLTNPSRGIGSGVMAWAKDYGGLYEAFAKSPEYWMRACVTSEIWGDQGFIQSHEREFNYFQDIYPGAIKSFKFDLEKGGGMDGVRVVCFNGSPKPDEVARDWIPPMPKTA